MMKGDHNKAVEEILGPIELDIEVGDGKDESIKAMGEELMGCFQAGDVDGMLASLRSLFDEFDSQPHEEGPHI
jgi:hypothetical protein